MTARTTALIADDEPLLRERLAAYLARLWPELELVAQARNGREAVELFEAQPCDIVFLDVHMPGLNGVEAARTLRGRCEIVFVTAYEQYAVAAFEQGAIDYLVKPFDEERLKHTVERLQARMAAGRDEPAALLQVIDRLSAALAGTAASAGSAAQVKSYLQWIKASVGSVVKLIPVDEVAYLRSDEKYTLVAWAGGEALIRKPIRELVDELDPALFQQVHRSVVVNLRQVAQVVRGLNETADIHLRGRPEVLPVSRNFLHLFRQM
jgi:DNA-binding LytR/AlgR family response regulator